MAWRCVCSPLHTYTTSAPLFRCGTRSERIHALTMGIIKTRQNVYACSNADTAGSVQFNKFMYTFAKPFGSVFGMRACACASSHSPNRSQSFHLHALHTTRLSLLIKSNLFQVRI